MRLSSVFISQYKNLENFSISFGGGDFVDIFVGKNGSGKSNLLEALVEMFQHIYAFDTERYDIGFNYNIKYEIHGELVDIDWRDEVLSINGRARKRVGETLVPENLIVYYSGHNDSVENLVTQYEERFRRKIKSASHDESRRIIGVGPEYKELLLAVLLIQVEACVARQFIMSKLGVKQLGLEMRGGGKIGRTEPVFKLVLERPMYASGSQRKDFNINNNDEGDRYWNPEGIVKLFLDRLHQCLSSSPGGLTIENGYFSSEDRYVLYVDIAKFQVEFQGETSQEVFRQLDNLKTLGMLSEISVPLLLDGDVDGSIRHFSDGQFQSVYIYALSELFKDRECITLLDEPDAFLHPEWQFEYLTQVEEISDQAAKTNHILMTSHSAVTLIASENKRVKFFETHSGRATCINLPKRKAIANLSNNLIQYREDESLLSIINTIQIESKPVFFTEGSTDPIILTEAWRKLYENELPFIPFYGFSCTYINQLLTDLRIHKEMSGLPVFSMFDFDKAFNSWNGLKGEVLVNDPSLGMVKKWDGGEAYAFMLPIPNNSDIHRQVYKDVAKKLTFEGGSHCAIEHCFYGYDITNAYFKKEPVAGGVKISFSGKKAYFAKEIVPLLPKEAFEVFRPLFEFVNSRCVADEAAA